MGRRVLVTGATGYIGGRLVPELLSAGHDVRVFARSPGKLSGAGWLPEVEVHEGDVTDSEAAAAAMDGCHAAYFLIHSMGSSEDFAERDRRNAEAFRTAAEQAGVERIVYLGGLGDEEEEDLSPHLASRHEVGRVLAAGSVPVCELRAAVVIGSGSASFEMLRNLAEVLPAMVTPSWVQTRCQPIAISDILHYLVGVLDEPRTASGIFEVGGTDVLTYEEMMQVYAQVAGLRKRVVIRAPVLTPSLSSLWVGLVTPLPPDLARPLIDSLVNEVVVKRRPITEVIDHAPLGFTEAVERALARIGDLEIGPTPAGTGTSPRTPADASPSDPDWAGGTLLSHADTITVDEPADAVFDVVSRFAADGSWLVQSRLAPTLLRVQEQRRLPGKEWREWTFSAADGSTTVVQRAMFAPQGLAGRLYWYVSLPLRTVLARRILEGLSAAATRGDGARALSDDVDRGDAFGGADAGRDLVGDGRARGEDHESGLTRR